jgi:hypothetical protein
MIQYSTYNATTGEITGHLQPGTTPIDVVKQVHPNIVEGYWPAEQYRIVDGVPTNFVGKPDIAVLVTSQRQHRNQLLSQVDRVNPIWYASLTSQQQSELAQYRQCLLDVPQQPGWPEDITWPRVPTWL